MIWVNGECGIGRHYISDRLTYALRHAGEYVYVQLGLLVQIVQAHGLVEFMLTRDCARIAFLVDPLDCELLFDIELAYASNELEKLDNANALAYVNDHDEATVEQLDFDLGVFVVVAAVVVEIVFIFFRRHCRRVVNAQVNFQVD
jgi:hypothetical protein